MPIENKTNFDSCASFFIDNGAYQGRLIRLNSVLNTILGKHCYPQPVSAVIAECTVLGTMLASMLKYDGLFTLQTQSNGVVSMVVVDVTSDGRIRACARYDQKRLEQNQSLRKTVGEIEPAPHLLGGGHLAFTVDQGNDTQLYQGIVDLQGKTLAECALRYFKQSEQIDTDLKLFLKAPEGDSQSWSAAGIMLQKMPSIGGKDTNIDQETLDENWNQAKIFMQSLSENEVFDANLTSEELLHRLFHANNLNISNCKNYNFGCRCSREKLLNTLSTFSEDDINAMVENNKITATCNFCSEQYTFDKGEVLKQ
ncbi:MAG: Hsp33 family molecular chaperone HslO [Alphaproteobacteria bacterium]|nr:molecular chaperone Hsp33 [Alphaproteobacteria bacterium]MBQ7284724.1 Hsp33 family molecular chaperone HslO [Alphaproteobacteria bacterium]